MGESIAKQLLVGKQFLIEPINFGQLIGYGASRKGYFPSQIIEIEASASFYISTTTILAMVA